MNFYEDIAHRLYVCNTKIGDTNFASPIDFIEAKHLESPYKGKIFYENVIKAMPNHFGAKMRSELFKEILQYCKMKIDIYESVYENPDLIYSISSEPFFFEVINDEDNQILAPNENCKKEHALDILNHATVSFEGKLEHPEQNFYDNKFIVAINATKNKAETIRFINHHYSRAKKKNVFLQKIDSLFERRKKTPIDELLTEDVRSVLIEWYIVEWATISDTKGIDDFQEYENTDSNGKENRFCKSMPLGYAREHFKVFVETDSNNKSKFLTVIQFENFIQRAFLGNKKIPKQEMNKAPREIQFVVRRFYEFYNKSVKDFYESQQSRDKFIKLLTDNFINWEFEKVKLNFNKPVKRKW